MGSVVPTIVPTTHIAMSRNNNNNSTSIFQRFSLRDLFRQKCHYQQLGQEDPAQPLPPTNTDVLPQDDLPLPDVVLCSWTASVLRDRRRERKRHAAAIQTPGAEVPDVVEIEPLVQDLVTKLNINEVASGQDEGEEDNLIGKRGESRKRKKIPSKIPSKMSEKLNTISAAATVRDTVTKASLCYDDTPEGMVKTVKTLIEPFFSN